MSRFFNDAPLHVPKGLGGENHGSILLPESLKPLLHLIGKQGVLQVQPRLIKEDEGRGGVLINLIVDPPEKIREDRDKSRGFHESPHLKCMEVMGG